MKSASSSATVRSSRPTAVTDRPQWRAERKAADRPGGEVERKSSRVEFLLQPKLDRGALIERALAARLQPHRRAGLGPADGGTADHTCRRRQEILADNAANADATREGTEAEIRRDVSGRKMGDDRAFGFLDGAAAMAQLRIQRTVHHLFIGSVINLLNQPLVGIAARLRAEADRECSA